MFEALKGMLVLSLGLALLGLLHRDIDSVVEVLMIHLHIDPFGRLAHDILVAASHISSRQLWGVAALAIVYSGMRFAEAWGLWHRRVWAEWFAMLSGAIYLPWEAKHMVKKPSLFHAALLLINLAVILYMVYIRWQARRQTDAGDQRK